MELTFALRATSTSPLEVSPAQVVFGRNMLFDIEYSCDWEEISENKRQTIRKSNEVENKRRIDHPYTSGDLIKLLPFSSNYAKMHKTKTKPATTGPYRIVLVYSNGTAIIDKGSYKETVSLRRLQPYQ